MPALHFLGSCAYFDHFIFEIVNYDLGARMLRNVCAFMMKRAASRLPRAVTG